MIKIESNLWIGFDTLEESEMAKKLLVANGYDYDECWEYGKESYSLQIFGKGHLSEKSTVALINNDLGLANLKTEMEKIKADVLNNRLATIKQKALLRDVRQTNEINEVLDKIAQAKREIVNLAPRIRDLFKVRDALLDNSFSVSRYINAYSEPKDTVYFANVAYKDATILKCKNTLWHRSCWVEVEVSCDEIWIDNAYTENNIDRSTHEKTMSDLSSVLYAMNNFINTFDKFEKDFYNYVDNLEGGK